MTQQEGRVFDGLKQEILIPLIKNNFEILWQCVCNGFFKKK